MKHILVFTRVFLAAFLIIVFPVSARAASITDELPLSALPLEGRENAYSITTAVSDDEIILAFDVSEEMGIVLVTAAERSSEKHLRYMDQDGNVIAVFVFECPGEVGIAWDGPDICLFYSRGDLIEKIDCHGKLKERYFLASSNYTSNKTWKRLAHRNEKTVETGTYSLRTTGLSPLKSMNTFSELVFLDRASGREQTIYKAGTITSMRSWLSLTLTIGFVVLVITMIIRKQKAATQGTAHSA